MWLLSSSPSSLLLPKTPYHHHHHPPPPLSLLRSPSLSFSLRHSSRTFASLSSSDGRSNKPTSIPDEWGEKSDLEPEPTRYGMPDPAIKEDVDKWAPGAVDGVVQEARRENLELKKALVDSVYGTDLGFRASSEVRAEASELVTKLEAVNPTTNPTETPALLDGNWILLYTAYSCCLFLLLELHHCSRLTKYLRALTLQARLWTIQPRCLAPLPHFHSVHLPPLKSEALQEFRFNSRKPPSNLQRSNPILISQRV